MELPRKWMPVCYERFPNPRRAGLSLRRPPQQSEILENNVRENPDTIQPQPKDTLLPRKKLRPFKCPFAHFGCTASFVSAYDQKRHANFHLPSKRYCYDIRGAESSWPAKPHHEAEGTAAAAGSKAVGPVTSQTRLYSFGVPSPSTFAWCTLPGLLQAIK